MSDAMRSSVPLGEMGAERDRARSETQERRARGADAYDLDRNYRLSESLSPANKKRVTQHVVVCPNILRNGQLRGGQKSTGCLSVMNDVRTSCTDVLRERRKASAGATLLRDF